jgi:hypothetical protein
MLIRSDVILGLSYSIHHNKMVLLREGFSKSKEMENSMGIKSLLLGGSHLLIQLNSKSHP